jgi:benzoylformate decarboxylase
VIQALWSAVRCRAGAIFVVLANDGYQVMNRLAESQGEPAQWPGFDGIDITAMAQAQGCQAQRVETHEALEAALDDALADPARGEPVLLEVVVAPDSDFRF